MDRHGTYHSACHALNIVVQMRDGLEVACDMTEALWELYPPEECSEEEVLDALLRGAWFDTRKEHLAKETLTEVVGRHCRHGQLVLMLLNYHAGVDLKRWAVVTSVCATRVEYAVCLEPGDPKTMYRNLDDAITGPCIVVTGLPTAPPRVTAFDVGVGRPEQN